MDKREARIKNQVWKNSKKGISAVVQCLVLSIVTASSIPGRATKIPHKKRIAERQICLKQMEQNQTNVGYGRKDTVINQITSYRIWQIFSIHKFRELQKEHLKALSRTTIKLSYSSKTKFPQSILLLLLFSQEVMSDSFVIPWTIAPQAFLFMGFLRQE